MTSTTQNGIDILCDAAGSDLLLSNLFPPSASEHQHQHQQQQQQPEQPGQEQEDEQDQERERSGKKVKRSETSPPGAIAASTCSSSDNHICHICKRVYERADHLTRHLRSHENARQYQCTRCPKRFNRADLLTRHEATHDRVAENGKPSIRRGDRAAQACEACAAAKAKCDDQKPCGRCRAKRLVCQATRRGHQYKTSVDGESSPDNGTMLPVINHQPSASQMSLGENMEPSSFMPHMFGPDSSLINPIPDDMAYFNPMHNLFQDIDFSMSWDLNFDAFSIPQLDLTPQGPSPQSAANVINTSDASNTATAKRGFPWSVVQDPSRGHAAFKRSPWLWEPGKKEDYVLQQKKGLQIDEQSISQSPSFGGLADKPARKLRMTSHQRDRIFSIVLAQNKESERVPSFPSLDLLNYLLQAYFVQDDYQYDSWIHAPTFDPENTMPEFLAAIVSSGATFISVPAIWQFGLAMHEVVRLGLSNVFESNNAKTRDLKALQGFMLVLDVGIWSGFKRQMEIAESFLQPVLTMLRRAGAFSAPADSPSLMPLESDSAETVREKWQRFITRESYKRLIIHLFIHDVQTSVSLQTNPLVSYNELLFSLPASSDLWRAPTAEAWRQIYLSRKAIPRPLPRMSEMMHCVNFLDELEDHIDIELCYSALLHGYWGQISAYREASRFYASANKKEGTHWLWLKSQHQELYHDLCASSTIIDTSRQRSHSVHLAIVLELFLMILHVSPDELARFAGKYGEEEAQRAASWLVENWANTSEARYAVWHAGQVFHNARRLPPASLRGFNAIAVYLASLTLWVYGLLSCSRGQKGEEQDLNHLQPVQQGANGEGASPDAGSKIVVLDGEETRETKAFLQFERGLPGLTTSTGAVEVLSNPGMTLCIASGIYRENFPVSSEPLPPLVESLRNLLRDLGSSAAGMPSAITSRVQSSVASRMGSEDQ